MKGEQKIKLYIQAFPVVKYQKKKKQQMGTDRRRLTGEQGPALCVAVEHTSKEGFKDGLEEFKEVISQVFIGNYNGRKYEDLYFCV